MDNERLKYYIHDFFTDFQINKDMRRFHFWCKIAETYKDRKNYLKQYYENLYYKEAVNAYLVSLDNLKDRKYLKATNYALDIMDELDCKD